MEDTIAAIATPVGKGGISIVRISGEKAHQCLDRIFKKENMEYRKMYYGAVCDGEVILDKCLCVKFEAGQSFTGEPTSEIQCHGGYAAARDILAVCLKNGARLAQSGEFTKRAFINGKIDLSQAEAVGDMIDADTSASLRAAARLLSGELGKRIAEFQDQITEFITLIEAAIDYPDEIDQEVTAESIRTEVKKMIPQIHSLVSGYSQGRITKDGLKVCILGKPNAGKSSVLNYLCGENRAIVTSIAGTTRDTIHEVLELSGVKVHIYDTAGIRESDDIVEQAGVQRSVMTAEESDIVLLVSDVSEKDSFDFVDLETIRNKDGIVLLNKCDISKNKLAPSLNWKSIYVSALTGEGMDQVLDFLNERAKGSDCSSHLAITSARHAEALKNAENELNQCLDEDISPDLMTVNLTEAWQYLGLLTGKTVTDDIINNIFEKFCVGK